MQVKKTTQETVYPAAPSAPGGLVQLTALDQVILPRRYISLLLVFTHEPLPDASDFLKASLAQTLTLFYPCAGRFREAANGGLEIVCNDAGALFTEAWVDCKLDNFLPNFQPHPDFAVLVPKLDASAAISDIPLFCAQVTHFECGHICLGISLNHRVCDGHSAAHFLSTWATLTKSRSSPDTHAEGAQPPHIDRSFLLEARELPLPNFCTPGAYLARMPNFPTSQPPCTVKIFHFTASSIDGIREKASSHDNPSRSPSHTRFEALTAHLWRGIIYARGLAPDQEIRLGVAVDGRKRFEPPIPEGYFGNVGFRANPACRAGELVEGPLSFGAGLLKTTIAQFTDVHMRSALEEESLTTLRGSELTPFVDIFFTSWWKFPFYDLDFGWGKPSFVRVPVAAFDGVVVLLPSPAGPAYVDVLVGLQVAHMPKFEEYIDGDV